MNKIITGLLVVVGIMAGGTAHAVQLTAPELAGVCTATHIEWAHNIKNSRPDIYQKSLTVVNQLDGRYKNNPQYENMIQAAIKGYANIAAKEGNRGLATALIRLGGDSCSAVGQPSITTK